MKRLALRPSEWPITAKVPMLVVVLMLAVSAVVTNQVLSRLAESQWRHFDELAASYLDGLSSSLVPAVLREDVWETFDTLDRARNLYQGLKTKGTVVANSSGTILAATDPVAHPSYSAANAAINARFLSGQPVWHDEKREVSGAQRALLYHGRAIGTIYAEFDVADLFSERRTVLWTLIATNALITLGLAAFGYLSVLYILRPVHVLTRHLHQGVASPIVPIPQHRLGPERSEFGQLFRRYNALVQAMSEREQLAGRLAEEERLASLGRLASGLAHEINNPLGGLFNAIDTLKRHGDRPNVRSQSLDLIERGLRGIRDVVRTVLVTYRPEREPRHLTPADIDDMRILMSAEAVRKGVQINWANAVGSEVELPATQVRQILLNLALNAIAASPENDSVDLHISCDDDRLAIEVADRGPGLPSHAQAVLAGSQGPSLAEGSGLGLWMTRRMVAELKGTIDYQPRGEGGTLIRVALPLNAPPMESRHVA
jgi:signal transduction histidine kinase